MMYLIDLIYIKAFSIFLKMGNEDDEAAIKAMTFTGVILMSNVYSGYYFYMIELKLHQGTVIPLWISLPLFFIFVIILFFRYVTSEVSRDLVTQFRNHNLVIRVVESTSYILYVLLSLFLFWKYAVSIW